MPLTVIKSNPRKRRFLTYDLEWVPAEPKKGRPGKLDHVRIVGVYDGVRYRSYRTVRDFLRNELNSENRGRWFYAHAGGMADVQFVLEEIAKVNLEHGRQVFEVECSFSGSSAIIVHVKYKGTKNVYHFIDSFWLLRTSLEKIGKGIGIEKLGPKNKMNKAELRKWFAECPEPELRTYNQRDCEILWHAIERFQNVLLDMGSQLQMTQASSAMQLFRRSYLKKDVPTNELVNGKSQGSYFASRVEVFTRECEDANYFDINSSFPFAMTFPCPGPLTVINQQLGNEGDLFIADVEIDMPDNYLTPVPYRTNNRVFFPTGRWRTWLTSIDLFLMLREGGHITRVHEVMHFEPMDDLADYARDVYAKRQAAEGFEKEVYKITLNSLYGKFAEGLAGQVLHIDPPREIMETLDPETQEIMPGVWLVEKEKEVPHRHVPISTHITSFARRTLFDLLTYCSEFHYCDTDGFSTVDMLRTGKELGALKLEKHIRKGRFVQAKLYALSGTDDEGKPLGANKEGKPSNEDDDDPWLVKSKGFTKLSYKKFCDLVDGGVIEVERMARIRDIYRRGELTPEEILFTKRLNQDNLPKRYIYPDGSSRPWSVEELATGDVLPKGSKY